MAVINRLEGVPLGLKRSNSLIQLSAISESERQMEKTHKYSLYAFVVHDGYSTQKGHYVSFVKSRGTGPNKEDLWYKYDDESVKCLGPSLNNPQYL